MTGCQVPLLTVENGLLVFQAAVDAFFSVHGGGSVHRLRCDRATKTTDDFGRFDDESRFGGYRGHPQQRTPDSASSRGRAIQGRELGPESVSYD